MHKHILGCREKSLNINAQVIVETLILGIDQHLEERRVHLIILHRSTVLVIELSYHLAVGAIDIGGVGSLGIHDVVH